MTIHKEQDKNGRGLNGDTNNDTNGHSIFDSFNFKEFEGAVNIITNLKKTLSYNTKMIQ